MKISRALIDDWHPVARSDALGQDQVLAARLLGEDLVLWRSEAGVFAWQDLCIHRGTRLSLGKIDGGLLVCPYHGWRYDGSGQCVRFPAHPDQQPPEKAHVRTFRATEKYGLIWASLGEPAGGVPLFPEEADLAYHKVLCGPSPLVHASAPRIVENFLDIAHFAFVHPGYLGDPGHPEMPDYRPESGPQGIAVRSIPMYQPDPYGTGAGETVYYDYEVWRPFTAYLTKTASHGERFTLALFVTPHDETTTTAWFYMAVNEGIDTSDAELIAFQNAIFAQDRPIVESQRPELLPLDLQAELHLRCDRTAVAYRRWLHEQEINFGTT